MRNRLSVTMAILILASAAGCVSLEESGRRPVSREQLERDTQNLQIQRLSEKMESLSVELERIYPQLDAQRAASARESKMLRDGLAELERKLQTESRLRDQSKQEIIEHLSQKIAELLKASASSHSSSRRTGGGWEHSVQAGENLSQIAAQYKSTVSAIMKANNLNSDVIRVGQKLVIPE